MIRVNEEIVSIEKDALLSEIIDMSAEAKKYRSGMMIKVNGRYISIKKYCSTYIAEGDVINIYHMVSGG